MMRSKNRWTLAAAGVFAALALLGGCTAGQKGGEPEYEEGAIIHQVSDADKALAASTDSLTADTVTLWVNGLGCPQCASNIDLQLARISGVHNVWVDLGNGKVTLGLRGSKRPSPARLGKAVADAGFTLVKVETEQATQ